MIILSVKIYFSKYRTRTWGSAPPPCCTRQILCLSEGTNEKYISIFFVSAREDSVQQEGHGADPDGGAPAGRPGTPEPR